MVITNFFPDNVIFLRLRGFLYSFFVGSCGKNLRVGRNVTFYNSKNLQFGSDVYIAEGCWFNASESIIVSDEVLFGPKCIVVSSNHSKINNSYRYGLPKSKPIFIGRGTWICGNCTITAGSNIGSGCLIAANSVTINDYPDNSIISGVPGKVISKNAKKD